MLAYLEFFVYFCMFERMNEIKNQKHTRYEKENPVQSLISGHVAVFRKIPAA